MRFTITRDRGGRWGLPPRPLNVLREELIKPVDDGPRKERLDGFALPPARGA